MITVNHLKLTVLFLMAISFFTISKSSLANSNQNMFAVTNVIDGDTIKANIRGKVETIRLLGIDTPETVDPRKPVQCFGKAATDKMKSAVAGKEVRLVDDSTQGNRDKYKRLLRYIYLPDGTFVNAEMVKQGYAFSYRQYPTKYLDLFNKNEAYAREHNLGLWSSCPLIVDPTRSAVKKTTKSIVTPTHTYTAPSSSYVAPVQQSAPVSSSGDKNCSDFATHAQAQAYFTGKGGSASSNVDGLDRDHDGIACESLP